MTGEPIRGEPFGARLRAATQVRGPLCVGIDPHPQLVRDWGLNDDASGLERFARGVVAAVADQVAVVKPQSAFFERHGSAGVAVLERVIADARAAGALVLADVKRGDIGSTMRGYAEAYMDPRSALSADAMTASPFLGFGSLRPLLSAAAEHGAGVFVLVKTSNPEGVQIQNAHTRDGATVAATLLDHLAEENATAAGLGSVGAVVGATVDADPLGDDVRSADARLARANGPLLAPGLGAQGANAADLRRVFGAAVGNVLPAVSREVLTAGPAPTGLRAAADQLNDACWAVVSGAAE